MENLPKTNGSGGDQDSITQEEFMLQLGKLAEQWRTHRDADLDLRHKTGVLLNRRFGSPEARQKRGNGVLEQAAEQLQTTQSELSRMRRFAFHFKSIQELKEKHPEAATWTAVKALLPKLKPSGKKQEGQSAGGGAEAAKPEGAKSSGTKSAKFRSVKRYLAKLSSKVGEAGNGLTEAEKKELLEDFRKLAKALEECLPIRVSVDQVSAGATPPAAQVA